MNVMYVYECICGTCAPGTMVTTFYYGRHLGLLIPVLDRHHRLWSLIIVIVMALVQLLHLNNLEWKRWTLRPTCKYFAI